MLQNLLQERFGLTYHFEDKTLRGFHLAVAKGGPKLKESTDAVQPAAAAAPRGDHQGWAGAAGGGGHSHGGVMNFNGQARFQADHQRMSDLAELVATQLMVPVDDETGLSGQYDIALNWAADAAQEHSHAEGAGSEYRDAAGREGSAPPLATALQLQLGLRLVAAEKTATKVLVVAHLEKQATEN